MSNSADLAQDRDYQRGCECGIEPPGSISHKELGRKTDLDKLQYKRSQAASNYSRKKTA